jgi:energy-converting hydrogenase Eha subunit C
MFKTFATGLIRRMLALLALACFSAGALAAPIASTYHVELDTGAYAGTGWLDLQFNPGMDGAPPATASISNFTGLLDGAWFADGAVSGSLPGVVGIGNSTVFNSLFSAITLGGKFSFDLGFASSGPASASPAASVFSVALYGEDQSTALGTPDPFLGSLLRFEVLDGGVSVVLSDSKLASVASVASVPEPATALLILLALAALGASRRYQRLPKDAG